MLLLAGNNSVWLHCPSMVCEWLIIVNILFMVNLLSPVYLLSCTEVSHDTFWFMLTLPVINLKHKVS